MRLYIVDDAFVMRAAIGHVAIALGHTIVGEAASLEDALVQVPDIAIDAILVDGRLPPGSPTFVVAAIRGAAPDTAVVIIAALDETTLVAHARAAGASGAVLRPVTRSGLETALASVRIDSAAEST